MLLLLLLLTEKGTCRSLQAACSELPQHRDGKTNISCRVHYILVLQQQQVHSAQELQNPSRHFSLGTGSSSVHLGQLHGAAALLSVPLRPRNVASAAAAAGLPDVSGVQGLELPWQWRAGRIADWRWRQGMAEG